MAVFKPPYGTSEERQSVTLEDGELMFDTTVKAFYTGDGTPGGRAINGTTIAIGETETLPFGSDAQFEEAAGSTPQARIYNFKYPQAADTMNVPTALLTDAEAVTPETGKVTPFLRTAEEGTVEFAVKMADGTVAVVSGSGNGSGIVPAVCTAVNGSLCSVRAVSIASDGSVGWDGDVVESIIFDWEAPAE